MWFPFSFFRAFDAMGIGFFIGLADRPSISCYMHWFVLFYCVFNATCIGFLFGLAVRTQLDDTRMVFLIFCVFNAIRIGFLNGSAARPPLVVIGMGLVNIHSSQCINARALELKLRR